MLSSKLFFLFFLGEGKAINLDIKQVEAHRNFCNKLWNATKFALTYISGNFKPSSGNQTVSSAAACEIALSKLGITNPNDITRRNQLLNEHLRSHSYMGGWRPCIDDAVVFNVLRVDSINDSTYPYLSRWRKHIDSFKESEKALWGGDSACDIHYKVRSIFLLIIFACFLFLHLFSSPLTSGLLPPCA